MDADFLTHTGDLKTCSVINGTENWEGDHIYHLLR